MSDLREKLVVLTQCQEPDSYCIEDYYDKELIDNQLVNLHIEFIIAKNKDGETGTVGLQFYKKSQRFYG